MSLYQDLIQYTDKKSTPLHMPGHKRNPSFPQPEAIKADITEIPGFDSLYEEEGPLLALKERVQKLYHSENSFLLVNGSTGGLLTAIRSATKRGDTVLMARNCHCAVYHAIRMFGLHAEYIQPNYDKYGIAEGIRLEQVQNALNRWETSSSPIATSPEPAFGQKNIDNGFIQRNATSSVQRPALVILTSPTYEGRISELKAIADYLHRQNIPLLVDEAHGAHLSLHPTFEGSAVSAGADLVVQSLHKTLPALTQTALLHVNGSLVSLDRIRANFKMLQTSSPSFLLLSSVDQCMDALEKRSEALFSALQQSLLRFYKRTKALNHLHVISPDEAIGTRIDPSRIVVTTPATLTGLQLAKRLKVDYNIELEASAPRHIIAITGIADTAKTFEHFADALLALDGTLASDTEPVCDVTLAAPHGTGLEAFHYPAIPESVYDSHAVEYAPTESLPYSACEGRISAEFLYLYPPGIPLLVPGERINKELFDCIGQLIKENFSLYGPKHATDKYLQVIREN